MLAQLADVSIRSVLLALSAALALWILRSRRTAALQHAGWTAVVCGTLVLFAFGHALPRLPLPILGSAGADIPAQSVDLAYPRVPGEARGLAPLPDLDAAKNRRSIDWSGVGVYVWAAIAFALLVRFSTGVLLVRKLLATAQSIPCVGAVSMYESERVAVPMTVGWMRPRILLPLEWRTWDREKLDAVLAHEGAHAHRHDGLVAGLAAVNRCIFWFHPLAWMLERKLALLAEQACDESCVAALGDRERYARLLLDMALVVDRSEGRLHCHALTMAAGSHIRRRIDLLLQEGRTFSRGLTWTGWAAVALCGIPLVWGAGAVELDRQPLLRLEIPRWKVPAPPLLGNKLPEQKRVRPPVTIARQGTQAEAPAPQPKPKFEVASIKPCAAAAGGGPGRKGGGGGRGTGRSASPGTLYLPCLPVMLLIRLANVDFANGKYNPPSHIPLEGGPAWINTDRYLIEAKAEGDFSQEMMQGPMLEALLEERFHLKVHRETREVPIYALTVAKGGLKLQRPGDRSCTEPDAGGPDRNGAPFLALGCVKLQRSEESSCTATDVTQFPRPPLEPGQKPRCGIPRGLVSARRRTIDLLGASMMEISLILINASGRPVIDKTGIAEKFDFHLEFAPEEAGPSDEPDAPASIFTAMRQLGLKLEPAKGPSDFLVIDRVERPSEN